MDDLLLKPPVTEDRNLLDPNNELHVGVVRSPWTQALHPGPNGRVFGLYLLFFSVFGVAAPWTICNHYDIAYYPQDFYRMGRLGGDYVATYEASRSILLGRSIFKRYDDTADWSAQGEPARYSYPPTQAYLLTPLALLPFEHSHGVWIGLTIGFVVLSICIASRLFEVPWMALLAGCAIYAQSTFMIFQGERGQTDALPLLCIALSVYFCVRRSNPYLAGIFCALGACIKVIPIALCLYFLLHRNWRALLSTAVSGAVIVLATGVDDWMLWWNKIVPDHAHVFIGYNSDHSIVYLLEAFIPDLTAAREYGKVIAVGLVATYAVLVLLNRNRKRHVLIEVAILSMIVEISTPWSVNYKLVVLVFFFLSPFAILSFDRARAKPVLHAMPLFLAFFLIVPMYGEYLVRLPYSLLSPHLGSDLIVSNPFDPLFTDRKVAVGIIFSLSYLLMLYGREALASRPALESKYRRFYATAFFGIRSGRIALVLVILAVLSLFGAAANAAAKPAYKYQLARERFGEPKALNEWSSVAGVVIEPEAEGVWSVEIIFESRGPMPKNLLIFLHAGVIDEEGELAVRIGRNFFPSFITSYWPAGKFVVAKTRVRFPVLDYALRVGFYRPDNGSRLGQCEVGRVN